MLEENKPSQGELSLDDNLEQPSRGEVLPDDITEQPSQGDCVPANPLSIYDLVYGILFDPVNTFRRVITKPPVALTIALILGLNLILAIMDMATTDYSPLAESMIGYSNDRLISVMQSMAPMMAMAGFIINTLIWFVCSGVLHLIAEFYGGRGSAVNTFTVYGLAGLPGLLLLPLQGMEMIFTQSSVVNVIALVAALAVAIWSIVLLVIGLREVHSLTTGKAVLVIATPVLVGLVLLIIIVMMLVGVISSAVPYLEQFGKL